MLNFSTNRIDIENELLNEVKLFFYDLNSEITINHEFAEDGDFCVNTVTVNNNLYRYNSQFANKNGLSKEKFFARCCKKSVYDALSDFTKISAPWGSLTGIRPTKIGYEHILNGGSVEGVVDYMVNEYSVTRQKAELIYRIIKAQQGYSKNDDDLYNFYVHIPYCTSKCSYCSFTTFDAKRFEKTIPHYCDLLVKEIEHAKKFRAELGERVYSYYVGGGTPTALGCADLERVLRALGADGEEFTCEAGRPDTINREKLKIMKDCGVTRVCVNPQSFNDKTLLAIGRNHTVSDFYDKYEMVKSFGFDVNVDLIAGLPGENVDDFIYSVNAALRLRPDNLTVHTLSRKNGSAIKNSGSYDNLDIEKMIEYSSAAVEGDGYLPYYLYRQKSMLGNLENTGYCLAGKQCINNITTMEELLSVEACGAGAISKRVFGGGERIERLANLRDVKLYCEQFEERLLKKEIFNAKQFTN